MVKNKNLANGGKEEFDSMEKSLMVLVPRMSVFILQLKCSQYWPSRGANEADQNRLENGNNDGNTLELPQVALRIELLSEKKYADYVVRDLR